MSQAAHKGHGNAAQDGLRAAAGEKMRAEIFKASQREKERLREETAAYRLQGTSARFASTSNAAEVQLAQSTVGLVSKEEFARHRQLLEQGAAATPETSAPAADAVKKKKKKPKERTTLSFAMDDEDAEPFDVPQKKPKLKASGGASHALRKEEETPSAAPAPAAAAAPEPAATLPPGYCCIRHGAAGSVEVAMEAMASQSAARTKITGIASHGVSMNLQATERGNEANEVLCAFLKAALGGTDTACEVVRGHRAPVKVVQLRGVKAPEGCELLDHVYDRLLLAQRNPPPPP